MDFHPNESICKVCQTIVFPGETHNVCNKTASVSAIHQCIICLQDESKGEHRECQNKTQTLRQQLFELFAN